VSTTTSPACLNGLGCELEINYRVLDSNGGAMNIAGMRVAESISKNSNSTCSSVSLTDAGVWTTDSTGSLTAPDMLLACSNDDTTTCTLYYTQTFTVNGFSVLIKSQDGLTAGSKNTITLAINNGVSACPVVVITP